MTTAIYPGAKPINIKCIDGGSGIEIKTDGYLLYKHSQLVQKAAANGELGDTIDLTPLNITSADFMS
jgi:hypothetical protein